MSRSYISDEVDNKLAEGLTRASNRWTAKGIGSRPFDGVREELAFNFRTASYYDYSTSRRLAYLAAPGLCYWNAAGQLLTQPNLARCDYCEGVAVHLWPLAGKTWAVSAVAEGFLIKPDGGVIDSTPLLEDTVLASLFGSDNVYRRQATLEKAVYIPLERYSKEFVGDNWEKIPLTLESPASLSVLVDTLTTAVAILDAATREPTLIVQP